MKLTESYIIDFEWIKTKTSGKARALVVYSEECNQSIWYPLCINVSQLAKLEKSIPLIPTDNFLCLFFCQMIDNGLNFENQE